MRLRRDLRCASGSGMSSGARRRRNRLLRVRDARRELTNGEIARFRVRDRVDEWNCSADVRWRSGERRGELAERFGFGDARGLQPAECFCDLSAGAWAKVESWPCGHGKPLATKVSHRRRELATAAARWTDKSSNQISTALPVSAIAGTWAVAVVRLRSGGTGWLLERFSGTVDQRRDCSEPPVYRLRP